MRVAHSGGGGGDGGDGNDLMHEITCECERGHAQAAERIRQFKRSHPQISMRRVSLRVWFRPSMVGVSTKFSEISQERIDSNYMVLSHYQQPTSAFRKRTNTSTTYSIFGAGHTCRLLVVEK